MNALPVFSEADFKVSRKIVNAPDLKLMEIVWLKYVCAAVDNMEYQSALVEVKGSQTSTTVKLPFGRLSIGTTGDFLVIFSSRDAMNCYLAANPEHVKGMHTGGKICFAYLKCYDSLMSKVSEEFGAIPIFLNGFPEARPGEPWTSSTGLRTLRVGTPLLDLRVIDPIELAVRNGEV